jgi:hypothetical protein
MAFKRIAPTLTAEQLRAKLDYDPLTGVLTWRHRDDVLPRVNKRFVGKPAGCDDGQYGYISIRLLDRLYQAHRLVWLHVTGEWPDRLIDHVDLDPKNNRWDNLRLATKGQNMMNQEAPRHNTSGIKGVTWNAREHKWQAQIQVDGKNHHLGTYERIEDAAEARRSAATRLHGEFARFA